MVNRELSGFVIVGLGFLMLCAPAWQETEQTEDLLFPKGSESEIAAEWKRQRDMPTGIEKVAIDVTRSRHGPGNFDIFTDTDIEFSVVVDSPEICEGIARKIHGTRGPCYGTYFVSGPPDTKLGTLKFYPKNKSARLIVQITNSGFYLGDKLDPRMKFHSWHLAKILNDVSVKEGTSLTQRSFNALSGVSWIVRDQHREINFDKVKYQNRAADVWNFLPSEVLTRSKSAEMQE